MDAWVDRLAAELGEDELTSAEATALLAVARDVAHRVERKITPLASFLLGCAVGRRVAGGSSRSEAIAETVRSLGRLLPEPSAGPSAPAE